MTAKGRGTMADRHRKRAARLKIRHKPMDRAWSVLMWLPGHRERQLNVVRTRPEADKCLATVINAFEKFPVYDAAPAMLEALKYVALELGTVGEVTEATFQRVKDAITEADGWDK